MHVSASAVLSEGGGVQQALERAGGDRSGLHSWCTGATLSCSAVVPDCALAVVANRTISVQHNNLPYCSTLPP